MNNKKSQPSGTDHEKKGWVWAPGRQWLIAGLMATGVIIVDQVSKLLIVANIAPYGYVSVIGKFLRLTFAQNNQGVFALNYGPDIFYILLPAIALCLVIVFLLRRQSTFLTVLLGLILGGGISNNLIDRIRLGYVVDWVSVTVFKFRLSSFNIADASIVISLSLLIIYELFLSKKGTDVDKRRENNG